MFLYLSIVNAETVSSDICLCNIGRVFCRDREQLSPINLTPRHIADKLDNLGLKWMSCRRLVYGRWDMARTSCNYWAHDCLFLVFWKAITLKRRICYVGSDWGKTLTNLFDELHRRSIKLTILWWHRSYNYSHFIWCDLFKKTEKKWYVLVVGAVLSAVPERIPSIMILKYAMCYVRQLKWQLIA